MIQVLYNEKANNKRGFEGAKKIENYFEAKDVKYVDVLGAENFDAILQDIPSEDKVVLAGGDGTLNYFVNRTSEEVIRSRKIDYLAAGTGNDFACEFGVKSGEMLEDIGKYLVNLPTVTVEGKTYKFINGVGYGIDGYCCEEGDRLREISDKPINYAGIAIKGILFKFKPALATVTVDDEENEYKHCWLSPVMNGKFFGGGMMPTPEQDRLGEPRKISTMVYHCPGRLKALITFPGIFKGEHVKATNVVKILSGRKIEVAFSRPCACQIDGETIKNVSKISCEV